MKHPAPPLPSRRRGLRLAGGCCVAALGLARLSPSAALATSGANGREGPQASAAGPVWQVGPGRALRSPAMAADVVPDGAVVEIDPGEYRGDVAVWRQRGLTLRGTGPGVRLLALGRSAEAKAIWVLRRGDATIENIAFIGARVPDRNGAGIRHEGGALTVRHCTFLANENGILTGDGPALQLTVEQCEFADNGAGDGLSHGIYVGAVGRFVLRGSRLRNAWVGHLVKSRAQRSRVEYNLLTDGLGGQASYELEFPEAGEVEVVGNVVQQARGSRNAVMVSYGAEGGRWAVNRLALVHNTLVNDRPAGGVFVFATASAQAVWTRHNLWAGRGRLALPAHTDSAGDRHVPRSAFVQATPDDFRLTRTARAALGPATPLPAAWHPLHEPPPAGPAPLRRAGPLWPGAVQAGPPPRPGAESLLQPGAPASSPKLTGSPASSGR